MVKITKHELRLTAKNRGIKNYLNMSRERLLSTFDKSEHITENLSKNGLNKIIKIQNLSLNDLKQIERLNDYTE